MLNPNIFIPKIKKIETYNNVAVKVWFENSKNDKDYYKATIQRDNSGQPYDEFNLKTGVYICLVKKLFGKALTPKGIEHYASEITYLSSAEKEVNKAIKNYITEKNKKESEALKEKTLKENFERRKAKKIAKKKAKLEEIARKHGF